MFFSLFDSIIYSNSYLKRYENHNSFELNQNVILKTFLSNVRMLYEKRTFDSVISSAKLVQKLSSEH